MLLHDLLDRLPVTAPASSWSRDWRAADQRARDAITEQLAGSEEPFEGRIARDVVAGLPESGILVVASSMPVRDVETFAEPRADVRVIANRGVNGIDGFASTTLGVAAATHAPVVGLTGDLSFLHDTNGLLGAPERELDPAVFGRVENEELAQCRTLRVLVKPPRAFTSPDPFGVLVAERPQHLTSIT
jgi:2-succinyl-5-enolpyruvyl-6-hydroxy-3-cyclohexene-1-carboxylate synthase